MADLRWFLVLLLLVLVGSVAASPKVVRVESEPAPPVKREFTVDAILEVPRGFAPPRKALLRSGRESQNDVSCAVENARLVDCRLWLPVLEVAEDLRVEIPGLAPLYLFGEPLRVPGPVDLGNLVFEWPGRLTVRSNGPEGPVDPAAADVWLQPDWYQPGGGCIVSDPLGLAEVIQLDPAGGIEAEGLAAGGYLLRVKVPGYAPVRERVEIFPGTTTEVELDLVPLVPLEIRIDPPIAPSGGPWEVWLWPDDESDDEDWYEVDSDGEMIEPGLWRTEPIPPGIYEASFVDADREHRIGSEIVELLPGSAAVEVAVEAPTILVEGAVNVGGRPLAALLFFTGSFSARSDESGSFRVVLPRTGDWSVSVRTKDETFEVDGLTVTVEATGPRSGQVGVELPDTRLTVTLVDEPADGSVSRFLELEGPLTDKRYVRFDAEGRGTLAGLPAGRYRISIDTWGETGETWVEIPESGEAEARLVVRPAVPLSGRVTSQDRAPVADATVFAVGPGSDDLLETRTDRGGWFHFQMERDPEARWNILVVAPDGEQASVVSRPGDEDLAITLGDDG